MACSVPDGLLNDGPNRDLDRRRTADHTFQILPEIRPPFT